MAQNKPEETPMMRQFYSILMLFCCSVAVISMRRTPRMQLKQVRFLV